MTNANFPSILVSKRGEEQSPQDEEKIFDTGFIGLAVSVTDTETIMQYTNEDKKVLTDIRSPWFSNIIYGEEIEWCAGDKLEAKGWVRATTSMMWDIRLGEWNGKRISQKQYDAVWDYCQCHKLKFPDGVEVR